MLRVIDCREAAIDLYPGIEPQHTEHQTTSQLTGMLDFHNFDRKKGLTVEEIYLKFEKYPQVGGCKKL